jgi:hypothetical protein
MPLSITSSVHKERDRGSTNTAVCALTLSAPPGFFTHEHAPRHLRYVEIRFEFVAKIVAALLVPRLNLLLLAIAACLLRLRGPRLGRCLLVFALKSNYLSCASVINATCYVTSKAPSAFDSNLMAGTTLDATAVAVPGGRNRLNTPESGGDTPAWA